MKAEERNASMDVLRIIAMFMILTVHFFGWGGAVNTLTTGDFNYFLVMPLYFIAGIGNTLFFLLSGYFAKKPKLRKALFMERKMAFYCVVITALVFVFGWNDGLGVGEIVKSFFPLLFNKYWFISVWIILYVCSYFLVPGLDSLSKKQFLLVIGALLINNTCIMNAEDTLLQGLLAYAVGFYIQKFKPFENVKKRWIVISYAAIMAAYVVERFAVQKLGIEYTRTDNGLRYFLLFLAAVATFAFFTKIRIRAKFPSKIAGNVVSVYLITANSALHVPLYDSWLHIGYFCTKWWFIGYYLLVNIALFTLCVLIDRLVSKWNNVETALLEKGYIRLRKEWDRKRKKKENKEEV